MLKIKKGDKVKVLIGKDKGKEGQVEKVFSKKGKVLVSGVNIYKKHAKPRQGKPGGIIDLVRPLPVSNVSLVCPKCGKATRVGFGGTDEKVRICRKCKEII
ncbi:MAG: 50S ribosomal protein L24 [bacterium]|nr:50S ribosomal protein L24 [bacterium]